MVQVNRIFCPIDFSDFSLNALRHGSELAQWYSVQVTPFHAYQISQPLPGRFCAPLLGPSAQPWRFS